MNASPPVRPITRGPEFHWFGYYDKLQFDPSGRFVLAMAVGFEGRSPTPDDRIEVGMIDLGEGDRWIPLGHSRAWCWQQGCMLQWLPGSISEVVWNDRQGERFVCHILDVATGRRRTVPSPVYTIAPDGRTAFAPDFRRINHTRPGYGYAGLDDPWRDEPAPAESGIWRVDLQTGQAELIVPLARMLEGPAATPDLRACTHWFNHLLVSPDGRRVVFLHRWRRPGEAHWQTRMLTVSPDGSDLRVVDAGGTTSHFVWRDPWHILAHTRHHRGEGGFYLLDERTGRAELALDERRDGHCSYLPGGEWIINDTYPQGPRREQELYLAHVATGRRVPLGAFASPPGYQGEWRCDLHPRLSRDGRLVTIDSVHGGDGRQVYLLDLHGLLQRRHAGDGAGKD